MYQGKKAQISLYLIIGVVLFTIVMVMVSLVSRIKDDTASIEGNTQTIQSLRSIAVTNYVNLCMENSLRRALDIAGNQSGVIYNDQFAITNPDPKNGKSYTSTAVFKNSGNGLYRVTIVEYQDQDKLTKFYCPASIINVCKYAHRYPYDNYLNSRGKAIDPYYGLPSSQPYFRTQSSDDVPGYSHYKGLAPLCNLTGPNRRDNDAIPLTCETYSIDGKFKDQSIQSYIQNYMFQDMSKANSCLDGIGEVVKTDVQVVKPIPSLIFTIHEDSVEVNMRVPIKITTPKGTTIETIDYSIRPKVRLRYFHEMIDHSIGNPDINPNAGDETDIFFDITKDDTKDCARDQVAGMPCKMLGMSISKRYEALPNENENPQKKYTVYLAEDNKEGYWPLKLYFAVGLRRPVIESLDPNFRHIVNPDKLEPLRKNNSDINVLKTQIPFRLSAPMSTKNFELNIYDPSEYTYGTCQVSGHQMIDFTKFTYTLTSPTPTLFSFYNVDPGCTIVPTSTSCGKIAIKCTATTELYKQTGNPCLPNGNGCPNGETCNTGERKCYKWTPNDGYAIYKLTVKNPLNLALEDYFSLNIGVDHP